MNFFYKSLLCFCIGMYASLPAMAEEEKSEKNSLAELINVCIKDEIQEEDICHRAEKDKKLQLFIGGQYFNGNKKSKTNYTKALEWFKKAAENGLPEAEYNQGLVYENGGYGIPAAPQLAIMHYKVAADLKHPGALYNLGRLYSAGIAVPQDLKVAGDYFYQAAALGLPEANYALAVWYMNTRPAEKEQDPEMNKMILSYIDAAIKDNVPEAFTLKGIAYEKGWLGLTQNIDKAIELYNQGNYTGDQSAQGRVAILLIKDKKYDLALSQLSSAVNDEHNSTAMCLLGDMYLNGTGVPADANKATQYYQNAADMNNPCGLFRLGLHYYEQQTPDYKKAFEYFNRALETGNADAETYLGVMYASGLGVPESHSRALKYFNSAALSGSHVAENELGRIYLNGIGTKQDYDLAMKYFSSAAEADYPPAIANLETAASWYQKAIILGNNNAFSALGEMNLKSQNYDTALNFFNTGAQKGMSDSEYWLGYMYEKGLGVATDIVKARSYYELASEHGSSLATVALGLFSLNGNGGKTDPNKAFELFNKAATKGELEAIYQLAKAYELGKGTKQDNQKALRLYQKAADKGHAMAQYAVGKYLDDGIFTAPNPKVAAVFYEKAANNGVLPAQVAIASMYEKGYGTTKSMPKALTFYKMASDNGDAVAMRKTAEYLIKEHKSDEDINAAIALYEKSAAKGDSKAIAFLGQIYAEGLKNTDNTQNLVAPNPTKALTYLNKASSLKIPRAQYALGIMYLNGTGVKKDIKKAKELILSAASGDQEHPGIPEAMFSTGKFYANGIGVPLNVITGISWYEQASTLGNMDAQLELGKIYLFGRKDSGIAANRAKAMEYLKLAAAKGSKEAQQLITENSK